MKIELMESGLDSVLKTIEDYLENALNAKSKIGKDKLINKAMGAVRATYCMVDVCGEKESEND